MECNPERVVACIRLANVDAEMCEDDEGGTGNRIWTGDGSSQTDGPCLKGSLAPK